MWTTDSEDTVQAIGRYRSTSTRPFFSVERAHVEVAVLGPIDLHGCSAPFCRPAARDLVVYLALHPEGATHAQWSLALWPDRHCLAGDDPLDRLGCPACPGRRSLRAAPPSPGPGAPALRGRHDRRGAVLPAGLGGRCRQPLPGARTPARSVAGRAAAIGLGRARRDPGPAREPRRSHRPARLGVPSWRPTGPTVPNGCCVGPWWSAPTTNASSGPCSRPPQPRATGWPSVPPWRSSSPGPARPEAAFGLPTPSGKESSLVSVLHPADDGALSPSGRPPACDRRASREAVGFPPAMARSSSGKSVARAAATGGGATYRGQMPVNWYAALVVDRPGRARIGGPGQVPLQPDRSGGPALHHDDLACRSGRGHLRDHGGGPAGLTDVEHPWTDHDRSGSDRDRAEERQ